MEVQLNTKTSLTINNGWCTFQYSNKTKTDYVYVKENKILGAQIGKKRYINIKRFLIALAIAMIGGVGHYLYDTVILKYNPNPVIISVIVGTISLIGLIIALQPGRVLKFIVDSNINHKTFEFSFDKDMSEDTIKTIVEELGIQPVSSEIKQYCKKQHIIDGLQYVRGSAIDGGYVTRRYQVTWKLFFIFVVIGMLGGAGHYIYDTVLLEYNPNPTIIGAIVGGVTLIGLISSIKNRLRLELIVGSSLTKNSLIFYLKKELTDSTIKTLLDGLRTSNKTKKTATSTLELTKQYKIDVTDGNLEESKDESKVIETTLKKEKPVSYDKEVQAITNAVFKDAPKSFKKNLKQRSSDNKTKSTTHKNYSDMLVSELKELAKKKNIDKYYKLRKAELISALKELDSNK